jgi:parallel beta-helix repeat protein
VYFPRKKTKHQLLVLCFIFAILCGIYNYSIILPQNRIFSTIVKDDSDIGSIKDIELKTSGYWTNFTFIHITGANWSTAVGYDWCRGNGSWINPYIIENISINANGLEYGIFIENSINDYFIIRNCSIYNSTAQWIGTGIKLSNTNNGTIMKNNISNNYNGISLYSSVKNNISGNFITYNYQTGISLSLSNYTTISGNNISRNRWGIDITASGNLTIKNNIISYDCDTGVYVDPWVFGATNNTFTGNYFISNAFIGLYFTYWCDSNIVFNNTFLNPRNVKNEGAYNSWSNISLGNSWNDYSGKDANDDGIGDTPYNILGSSGGQDDYPIFWDSPVISIVTPTSNQRVEETSPNFNISVIEGIPNTTWYSIYDGAEWSANYKTTGLSGQINQDLWDTLPDGTFTIRFYTNDSRGYLGFSDIQVTKLVSSDPDVIPPDPTIFIIWVLIFIAIAALTTILGVVYTRKSRKKVRERESEFAELQKIKSELTEEDFLISKERRICLVHKGIIEGMNFVCPSCGALYCVKCYDAVKDLENACWSCGNPLDPQKPVKKLKKVEDIGISDEDVEKQDIKHKKA